MTIISKSYVVWWQENYMCAASHFIFYHLHDTHCSTLWSSSSSSWWLVLVFLSLFYFFWFFISFAWQLCVVDVVVSIIQFILIDSKFIIIIECCWLSAIETERLLNSAKQPGNSNNKKIGKQREKEEKKYPRRWPYESIHSLAGYSLTTIVLLLQFRPQSFRHNKQ